jgi:predicted exporter
MKGWQGILLAIIATLVAFAIIVFSSSRCLVYGHCIVVGGF